MAISYHLKTIGLFAIIMAPNEIQKQFAALLSFLVAHLKLGAQNYIPVIPDPVPYGMGMHFTGNLLSSGLAKLVDIY